MPPRALPMQNPMFFYGVPLYLMEGPHHHNHALTPKALSQPTLTMGRTNKHKAQDAVSTSAPSKTAPVRDFSDQKKKITKESRAVLAAEHLPPLSLVCCVLVCSGSLFVLGLRDALATGKNIAGSADAAFLVSMILLYFGNC